MRRVGTRAAGTLLLVGAVLALGGRTSDAAFTDITEQAGLAYAQYAPADPLTCLTDPDTFSCEIEWMTGGAAVADVDGDGWSDLYVTRLDAHDLLFRNNGDGTFEDATASAGLAGFELQSNGAGFADVDRDGDPDLYVTTIGLGDDPTNARFYLFINDGTGRFTEEAVARGAHVTSSLDRGGYGVAFGDYDGDGWVDIYTTDWRGPTPAVALPHARLLRNRGLEAPGHFEDATEAAGVQIDQSPDCVQALRCETWSLAPAFVDLDADGWLDLAIASDFGTSALFWNDGDGTFTDGTAAAGVGTDENGMGSTFGDYDGDGDLDWFVTSIFDPDAICETGPCAWDSSGNRLYRNDGSRTFTDATDTAGVRDAGWGWGAVFFDADNDGDLDLVATNGVDFPFATIDAPYEHDPMRFWENDGSGGMAEASAAVGLTDTGSGKGLLTFDYDRDGDLDLFVVNNATGGILYRNDGGSANDWLRVRVAGRRSEIEGRGARIEVTPAPGGPTQVRAVGAGSHFLGQSERIAHFGLGPGPGGPVHEVHVTWPSGKTRTWEDVPRNDLLVAAEPTSCGLLGPEALLPVALLGALRRRRRPARITRFADSGDDL